MKNYVVPNARNNTVDFVKGVLVLCMVLYHSLNYFMTNIIFLKYLRFILPGFAFLSGFLITNILYKKYGNNEWTYTSKLITRGIKLVILFTSLNVIISLIFNYDSYGRELGIISFFKNSLSIYFNYTKDIGKLAAFPILLMIGYIYILAPLILIINKRINFFLLLLTVVLIISIAIIVPYFNVSLQIICVAYGALGMYLGFISLEIIRKVLLKYKLLIILCLLIYQLIITFWNIKFPLTMLGVVIPISFFYICGLYFEKISVHLKGIYLLGRFTLIAYIFQIAFLHIINHLGFLKSGEVASIFISFFITLFLVYLLIIIVNVSIKNSKLVNKLYRSIFA